MSKLDRSAADALHRQWEDARQLRDQAARRAVRYLNADELPAAKEAAAESTAYDSEMERLEAELEDRRGLTPSTHH